ncbi:MAG TPA: diphosphomevalonate decarboxylase, partial [Arenicellales bacterium]|nr:diphosphomevalonate decarboxylase [Arenicellales bacterium]
AHRRIRVLQAAAVAHPNIALIKYWGKQDGPGNRPAVPSLSLTLDTLFSHTRVRFDPELAADSITINGDRDGKPAARVSRCLDLFRARAGRRQYAHVESRNNFPTGAGLASSASGFAALVVAADRALALDLPRPELSRIARRSSGSAARSLYGGFVEMPLDAEEETARPLLDAVDWPLAVVVAVTDTAAKSIGSTEGMTRTARTSDYYQSWIDAAGRDFDDARAAVEQRDFSRLARVSEKSCLKMHGLMLSADPGLIYWNPATVACLHRLRGLREQGAAVFFTMDAGPQVKAVCLPGDRERVVESLASVPGVVDVLVTGLGPGARVVDDTW